MHVTHKLTLVAWFWLRVEGTLLELSGRLANVFGNS